MVFFGADDDPEVFDYLTDGINRSLRRMDVESILTVLVNFAHSLNPNAQGLFDAANQEFGQRLRSEYISTDHNLII